MKNKYVVTIPARIGSKRVIRKNIRLMNGKPMIAYSIEAAKGAKKVHKVFVNTDNDNIGEVAKKYGAEYYKRAPNLSTDDTKQDEFNYDFIKNVNCDAVVMVNPVSPLIEACDVDDAISYFEQNNLDTLISVKKEQLHAFFSGESLNFDTNELLPATQDIVPVLICTWNICIWRKESFIESYEKNGYAAFSGKVGQWPIDPRKSIKVSYEEDFRMAEEILKYREKLCADYKAAYHGEQN